MPDVGFTDTGYNTGHQKSTIRHSNIFYNRMQYSFYDFLMLHRH
jgi:hypothetical protein